LKRKRYERAETSDKVGKTDSEGRDVQTRIRSLLYTNEARDKRND
jgi:hypothetical protein